MDKSPKSVTHGQCNAGRYGYLPSRRAPPPLDRYRTILLGDRGTCVRTTCPRLLPESGTARTRTASFLKRKVGSRVVSVLDSGAERPGFKSQPRRCRVTVFDNIRASSHPSCLCSPSRKIGSSPLKGCGSNRRPGGKFWQPTARFVTHITCRLTAKNRDQLQNPTLGIRV